MGSPAAKAPVRRYDPLTAGERMAVSAAVTLVFEGRLPPDEAMAHFLKVGLPSLRPDPAFAALATAAARLLDGSYGEQVAALARLRDALGPILRRDFSFAMREVVEADPRLGVARDAK